MSISLRAPAFITLAASLAFALWLSQPRAPRSSASAGDGAAAATPCPLATPEPLWVEPVTSLTDALTQTITVFIGNGEAVTVTAESGVFDVFGAYSATGAPAEVDLDLLPGVTHHLQVVAHVRQVWNGLCPYGDYSLSTQQDREGRPLVIRQGAWIRYFLPLIVVGP